MSYTINPNAKNKWARNAENTMDLSLETDASSVYLDNGRTLEQEIGEGSMVSNIATVDSSMSKVNDGTLDGAYESCVFKGKSLVNISNKAQEIEILGRVNTHTQIEIANKDLLKRNTKYILILGYDVTFDTNSSNKTLYLDDGHSYTYIKGLTKRNIATDSGKGVFVSIITTKDEEKTSNSNIHITLFKGSDSNRVIISNLMLIEYQEGMENWDIPYFTGLCDVKMPILRNVGKNLLSIQDYSPKGTLTNVEVTRNTLKATVEGVWHGFEYILQLKPNTEYTFSFERDSDTVKGYIRHPENKGWTGGYGGYSNYTFTTRDTGVIRFTIESSLANNTIVVRNPMIVEGNLRPTSYENYKTNILRTSEEIVLREVGGVCDTYNVLTGEYVRRIGEIVLDGSDDEKWALGSWWTPQVETMGFEMPLSTKGDSSLADKLIHGKFNTITFTDIEYLGVSYEWQCLGIRIKRSKLSTEDITGLKMYLSQNPITVQYELAEPITTIVEPLTIPFAYQNGHVILESGYEGQSLLPTLEYSTVVNKTGLIENVAKTIQAQEKQLTMLEKMLIQNIINLDYNNTLLTLKNEMEEML